MWAFEVAWPANDTTHTRTGQRFDRSACTSTASLRQLCAVGRRERRESGPGTAVCTAHSLDARRTVHALVNDAIADANIIHVKRNPQWKGRNTRTCTREYRGTAVL